MNKIQGLIIGALVAFTLGGTLTSAGERAPLAVAGTAVDAGAKNAVESSPPRKTSNKNGIKLRGVKESESLHKRAVTREDYAPLARETPSVNSSRASNPAGTMGGAEQQSGTHTRSDAPSSLRARDRIILPMSSKPPVGDSPSGKAVNKNGVPVPSAKRNKEFENELLWREYPTDNRGSQNRKFWSSTGPDLGSGKQPPKESIRPSDNILKKK